MQNKTETFKAPSQQVFKIWPPDCLQVVLRVGMLNSGIRGEYFNLVTNLICQSRKKGEKKNTVVE